MDSLSNFPEYISAAAPVLVAAVVALAGAVWLLKATRRRGP
jgi:hypothetical protein